MNLQVLHSKIFDVENEMHVGDCFEVLTIESIYFGVFLFYLILYLFQNKLIQGDSSHNTDEELYWTKDVPILVVT